MHVDVCVWSSLGFFCDKFLDALFFQHHYCLLLFGEKKEFFLPAAFCGLALIIGILPLPSFARIFLLVSTSECKASRIEGTRFTVFKFSMLKLQARAEILCGLNGELQRVWGVPSLLAGNCSLSVLLPASLLIKRLGGPFQTIWSIVSVSSGAIVHSIRNNYHTA